MRNGLAVVIVGLLGCSQAGPSAADESPTPPPAETADQPEVAPEPEPTPDPVPEPEPVAEPEPAPQVAAVTVQMTAATLADDCGRGPTAAPPASTRQKAMRGESRGDVAKGARARRRCEQTSIQLAVVAAEGAEPVSITVKSVELLLESGDAIGTLRARQPSVWSDGDGYKPWDEKVGPGQDLSVSYALSQPEWNNVDRRRTQTYTVKAVISIAGVDQTVEHKVTVSAPTSLPPNVRT